MKKSDSDTRKYGFGTLAIHAGQEPDPTNGAVMTPIYANSTYAQESPGKHKGMGYGRADNPTRNSYQACVAALEGGKHGIAFGSGMAAIDTILHATVKTGEHIVACDDMYGGTFRIIDKVYKQLGIDYTLVDATDPAKFEAAFKPNTKLAWLESPTNPLMRVLDLEKLTAIARKKGAVSVVDNTFMSPYFQKPLSLGADIVTHSVTKYMNGHSDVLGGALVVNDDELYKQLRFMMNSVGGVPSAFDSFLVMRGLKTLHVRMERHAQNAIEIARFLEKHPKIEKVMYPGLESHPQHALARKQMTGFGGMMSFYVKGGIAETRAFMEKTRIFTLAESLGGVESLINHPAIMTHASIPAEMRQAIGIHDNLVRISVGIEDLADLKADLAQALG